MHINWKYVKRVSFILCSLFLVYVGVIYYVMPAFAEQSGSSPESGANSRITSMAATVAGLSYGSTAAGSWGDYGALLNRIFSAAQGAFNDAKAVGTKNGGGTGTIVAYTKVLGGVDDYNNNQTIPADTYQKTWTTCNSGNSYCGGDSNAEKQDPNTGLIWSARTSSSANWFTANNCAQPLNGVAPLGATNCSANGDAACVCTKLTGGSKTGCDVLGDGNWRLPYQKELMVAYVDGSWSNLTNAGNAYWSSTTTSNTTQNAWFTGQTIGDTNYITKITNFSVRCVR